MCKVLVRTNGMEHKEWLRYRKLGIGGSDAGAICGLNPYVSPMHVYLDKTGDESEEKENEAMKQGRELEEYVAKRFCEETGLKVRRANVIYTHEKYPFMLANVDRMIVGEDAGLECKTASPFNRAKWRDGEIPPHYLLQCHHYMAVTGAKAWYLAVVIYSTEFKYMKIERDEEIIQYLIAIESEFWNQHVLAGKLPEPDGSEAADIVINRYFRKAMEEEQVELQGFDEKIKRRMEINELQKKLDNENRMIEQEIKLYMGNAEAAISDSFKVLWKNALTSRLDTQKLKEELPDIYERFCKKIESRRFMVRTV